MPRKFTIEPMGRLDLIVPDTADYIQPSSMRAYVRLDTRTSELDISFWPNHEKVRPSEEAHSIVLTWELPPQVNGEQLTRSINGGQADAFLNRIVAGSSVEWDGCRHVNRMTVDAQQASIDLGKWWNDLGVACRITAVFGWPTIGFQVDPPLN